MPSLGGLVDEIIGQLHGHVDLPAAGTLTSGIDADDTSLLIDFGDTPGAARPNGLIEIDSELLHVTQYDPTTGTAVVAPWGRGARGTTAAGHAIGAMVTVRPRFPRKRVIEAINETIRGICPPLYVPTDLAPIDTGALIGLGYPLPANTLRVLRVDATDVFGGEYLADRRVLRHWRVRNVAGTQLLEVDRCEVFQTLQVTIAAEPTPLVNESDDFAITGLSASCTDVVIFGALAKLVMGVELARQQVITPEAMARADKVPVQSGLAISRYYTALFQQRLSAEQDRLNQQHPIQLLRRG